MSATLSERLRNLTRKQILIGGSVAVPVLAIGLGLMAAPKLDERPPMQPVSQERMQILVSANQPAPPPPMMASGTRLEVLPPGAASAAAPPRPVPVSYVAPAAADYGRDANTVREERLPEIRPDPPSFEDDRRAPRDEERYERRYEPRYDDADEPPPEDEEGPPSESPDEQY